MARDGIFLLKYTYRQLFPKHTRHSKFVGLCGGGGNTGPARSRASGQKETAILDCTYSVLVHDKNDIGGVYSIVRKLAGKKI